MWAAEDDRRNWQQSAAIKHKTIKIDQKAQKLHQTPHPKTNEFVNNHGRSNKKERKCSNHSEQGRRRPKEQQQEAKTTRRSGKRKEEANLQ